MIGESRPRWGLVQVELSTTDQQRSQREVSKCQLRPLAGRQGRHRQRSDEADEGEAGGFGDVSGWSDPVEMCGQ